MKKTLIIGLIAAAFLTGCSGRCGMSPAAAGSNGYACGKSKCASCSSCKAAKSCEQGKGCSSCPHKHTEGASCGNR
jgi:hypothetical protein